MPELPEVESLRCKLEPQILQKKFLSIAPRRANLRVKIPQDFSAITHRKIKSLRRRSKYLILDCDGGHSLIIHLGMSGRFFFCEKNRPLHKHDHVIFELSDGKQMRFFDPRRFGLVLLEKTAGLENFSLFKNLGVEPLEKEFSQNFLFAISRKKKSPIKNFLMNAKYVVGVGNIYANESLFNSGIHPERLAATLSEDECKKLVTEIKKVLRASIQKGGTTLRDYVGADEKPGLYRLRLGVYGRNGEGCLRCDSTVKIIRQAGRSTFYCPQCQS